MQPINDQQDCKCQTRHPGPLGTLNPQPHVYHLMSCLLLLLSYSDFSLTQLSLIWEQRRFKTELSLKCYTCSIRQVCAPFSPSKNPQNSCPKKQKGSPEFLVPFLQIWNPSWSFPLQPLISLATQKIRQKRPVPLFSLGVRHRQAGAIPNMYSMNVAHNSHHVTLLQEILITRKSSWGWKARESTRSWQDPEMWVLFSGGDNCFYPCLTLFIILSSCLRWLYSP